ncbi:MAG: hypothetical protein KBD01_16250 [Acidobacteria bacterium]|nr:hypothetical protein [Acidobacteriota bacterium]
MRGLQAWLGGVACLAASLAPNLAQTSSSYRLSEQVLNAGGRPANGAVATSSSYALRLEAIGEAVLGSGPASFSYRLDGGFVSAYPPPREVSELRFDGPTTLVWHPENSVGAYELYRAGLETLPGGYGSCLQRGLTIATATETAVPAPGHGFFYLVTARNRLGEEGTKGSRSDGTPRPNPNPCS